MRLKYTAQSSMMRGGRVFKNGDIVECCDDEQRCDLLSTGMFEQLDKPKPKKSKKASKDSQIETEE